MTEAVIKPVGNSGMADMSNPRSLSPSYVNSFRISVVTSRLFVHLSGVAKNDDTEFYNLCLSLARGIDYAVANNEIPDKASELPSLLKQVCQRKNDLKIQAAVMVLMISVKSACNKGWFGQKDKEELFFLLDEMQSSFCSVSIKDMHSRMKNTGDNLNHAVSTVMSRFYPGMRMAEILCLLEAMPGYDSYVTDLHISKNSRSSPDHKIYLFVAQTDNMETSACITSPQEVNFLLNGEGVDRRTHICKDPGPQMPTPVTHMLKYGSNLLQVVGQFNGIYIIVIAFMSVVATSDHLSIPDYIPPAATAPDPDNEIIEGPSRISLKCPISFGRIKIPVKGLSCKHLQCFDFNNYVGINSRRPLWRCPHCSQSVCFSDIRIDQSMVKVLKEVGEDVSYVKISSDGSWEAVTESNEKPHDAPLLHQETLIQNMDDDIMDLTEGGNEVDTSDKYDKKPSPEEVNAKTMVINSTPSSMGMANAYRSSAALPPHMEDGFWRDFYSSGLPPRMTNTRFDVSQSQISVPNNLQLQQNNNPNNIGYPTSASYLTRPLAAVQALPVQTPATVVEQQHVSGSLLNQNMTSQNQGHRHHQLISSQTPPQLGAHPASLQHTSSVRHTPTNGFDSHQQNSLNQRTPIPLQFSPQPPSNVRNGPITSLGSSEHVYTLASIHRATQAMSRSQSSIPTSSPSLQVASTGVNPGSWVDATGDQNWRPAGRMRGSLSGRAYTEALNHIIRPTQPIQAARPPPVLNAPRPFIPPHLQARMANNLRGPDSNGRVDVDK